MPNLQNVVKMYVDRLRKHSKWDVSGEWNESEKDWELQTKVEEHGRKEMS